MKYQNFNKLIIVFFILISTNLANGLVVTDKTITRKQAPFLACYNNNWVDSVLNTLSIDEKIAQLLIYPAYSNKDKNHEQEIKKLITEYKIGGIIFMQGGPVRQAKLTNEYQSLSKVPLFISMDAENSLNMRLDSTTPYPYHMTLGAITDNKTIYKIATEYARQLSRLGVHINFAPEIDINCNLSNPVINDRSFGEDKNNVAIKGLMYMKALQENKLLAVGKHFPGHGDTDTDSHNSLTTLPFSFQRLDTLELTTFQYLINNGLAGVMVSHLIAPAIDSTKNLPATISKKAITDLLKNSMDFNGLVFTDAMNMSGLTKSVSLEDAPVLAFIAGNDVLLFPPDPKIVIENVKTAIQNKKISIEDINNSCRKLLAAKYWCGLNNYKPICLDGIFKDINDVSAQIAQQEIIEKSITLILNKDSLIPLKNLDTLKIATISIGANKITSFQNRIQYYAQTDSYCYETEISKIGTEKFLEKLKSYNLVILGIHGLNRNPVKNFNITKECSNFVDLLSKQQSLIVNVFGNPYSIKYLENTENIKSLIVSYSNWDITNDFSAQLIFGGIPAVGRLPVSINEKFSVNTCISTQKIRLKYTKIPETLSINSEILYKVDSIMNFAIKNNACPGGQIVAAKDGVIFYQKSFGYFKYNDKSHQVNDFDIYDLASVTKAVSTGFAMQKLFDENKYSINDKLSQYLEKLQTTNKESLSFKEILTHQAGLISWINFYKETIKPENKNSWYRNKISDTFSVQVCKDMFILKYAKDSILKQIYESELKNRGKYLYSDLGFYLLCSYIEEVTKENIRNYVYENFYKPVGAWSTGYLPLKMFSENQIAPSEIDTIFRNQEIWGFVHDQGAAMLGGVSGHAGLFSNANDISKLLQIMLNKGEYGGRRYFSAKTIELFTKYQYDPSNNARALVWEKKRPTNVGSAALSASKQSYGHSGFTGTLIWADPEYNFSFVFLTNRTYPYSNNKILEYSIRTNIEEVFYNSFLKK